MIYRTQMYCSQQQTIVTGLVDKRSPKAPEKAIACDNATACDKRTFCRFVNPLTQRNPLTTEVPSQQDQKAG